MKRPDLVTRVQSAASFLPDPGEERANALKKLVEAAEGVFERWPELQRLRFGPNSAPDMDDVNEVMEEIEEGLELNLPFFIAQNKGRLEEAGATLPDTAGVTRIWKELRTRVENAPAEEQAKRMEMLDQRFMTLVSGMDDTLKGKVTTMPVTAIPKDLQESYYRGGDGKEEMFALHIFPNGDITDPVFMDAFLLHTRSVDPHVTGLPVTFLAFGDLMTEGLQRAVTLALILILVFLAIDFRTLGPVLLTFVPLVCGTIWMLGLMNVFGLQLNYANMMGVPLILGIGVDSGVHLAHRAMQGVTPTYLLSTTGRAVLLSSMTSLMGMGSMLFGTHGGVQSFGLLLVIGVASCLVASLVVVPAILQWTQNRSAVPQKTES